MVTFWRNLGSAFRQLRWKLTFSYTAVTVGALLVSMLVVAVLALSSIFLPYDRAPLAFWVRAANEQAVPLARMLLSESPPNTAGIADLVNYSDRASFQTLDLAQLGNVTLYVRATAGLQMLVFDAQGSLLGRTGETAFPSTGQPFAPGSIPRLAGPLQAALAGVRDPPQLVAAGGPGSQWAVAVPVFGAGEREGELLGAVAYVLEAMPTGERVSSQSLGLVGRSVLVFLLGAAIVGTSFGLLTARGMLRRFERLSAAAGAWSQGDFSRFIEDPAGDEISQLATRLNQMAAQLRDLLRTRQEMAVSEERNRLARDLHDGAKQQALAASFQLGTALALFERDPEAARTHLQETETLIDAVRQELTDVIYELRPRESDGHDLVERLEGVVLAWAQQNEVGADVDVQAPRALDPSVELALVRILQEALANVARHSRSAHARVTLAYDPDAVTLTVADDGCGFDTAVPHSGLGLHSMRERAEALSGRFAIRSGPGHGCEVRVTLPTG